MRYVGIQQRRIIKYMSTHPLGGWPTKWVVGYRDGKILARLEEKGLIKSSRSPTVRWVLTDAGREVASYIT